MNREVQPEGKDQEKTVLMGSGEMVRVCERKGEINGWAQRGEG